MQTRLISNIRDVEPQAWDALSDPGYPFTRHAFLDALESSGCVSEAEGWQPAHLLLEEDGKLLGAAPLYLKYHSRGEFVFDWAWADAYQRLGLTYYPKLLNAIPFTPSTGPRLLGGSQDIKSSLAHALREHAGGLGLSSAHALFLPDEDSTLLNSQEFLLRHDCQYHWHNPGYADFDAFLGALSASKRKKIRRERRRVQEAGIHMERYLGPEISGSLWETIYAFYADTYHLRGQLPYLNLDFWLELAQRMGDRIVVFLARHHGRPVAAALTLQGGDTLYGRHWGCAEDYHSLHFEACYYQGIDYCIEQRLARFDAGAQGSHKLTRGFMPVQTRSAHWVADPRLRTAISDFLDQERRLVSEYIEERKSHSPYKRDEISAA